MPTTPILGYLKHTEVVKAPRMQLALGKKAIVWLIA